MFNMRACATCKDYLRINKGGKGHAYNPRSFEGQPIPDGTTLQIDQLDYIRKICAHLRTL
jgi:hypothetical protein